MIRINRTRRLVIQTLLICVSVTVLTQGCKKTSPAVPSANVIIVNGCTGATHVVAKINNAVIPGANDLGFFDYTGYAPVTPNANVSVNFYQYAGNLLYGITSNFSSGKYYTVFAGGNSVSPGIVVTTDDRSNPQKGNTKLRFINLSPDNLNENFYVNGQKLDSNIEYMQCSQFFELKSDSMAIMAQDPLLTSAPYTAQLSKKLFDTGKIYTIMLTGTNTGSNTTVLRLTVIKNN